MRKPNHQELGEHVGEFHTGLRIPCKFCADIYTLKKGLEEHETEVHNQLSEDAKAQQEAFKCKFREENFESKREFMKHNKDEHRENLKPC